ncbi:MAG: M23 family metallopeptidase [Chitinophagaceae bacterium]|nr:MAG: M23 family metallopeptidase [Chitinophagaceae bacterium]
MKLFPVILLVSVLSSCAASKNPLRREVKLLERGLIKDDTSYIYDLPFENGKAYYCVQGYFSMFTHHERAALDFRMKPGSIICAAREGVVVRVKEDGTRGGMRSKYRKDGNNVVIEHPDGSRAGYWHLQTDGALVNVGDTVKRGQPIALSGNTGMTSFPHLHFIVWDYDRSRRWQQVPTRFETTRGVGYLTAIKRYRKPKAEQPVHPDSHHPIPEE